MWWKPPLTSSTIHLFYVLLDHIGSYIQTKTVTGSYYTRAIRKLNHRPRTFLTRAFLYLFCEIHYSVQQFALDNHLNFFTLMLQLCNSFEIADTFTLTVNIIIYKAARLYSFKFWTQTDATVFFYMLHILTIKLFHSFLDWSIKLIFLFTAGAAGSLETFLFSVQTDR